MELIRTEIENREHGGNIYKIAEESGVPSESLVDFSASINPLGVPGKVKEVINEALDGLVNYPDPDTKVLKEKIAGHYNVDSRSVVCANGSTELIYLVPRALKPSKVLITSPAFSEYERACGLNYELGIKNYELKEERDFGIRADEFITAMQGCDMAFLCNPNNPTGHLLKKEEVLEIADAARDMKCYLVVDEAFIDFVPGGSVIEHVCDNPYLIVIRSMTKFYALAGLRVGFGVFHEQIIERIKEFREPWTINNLAQAAAITALEERGYTEDTFELIRTEKEYIEKELGLLNIKFFPSAVNYYLLKIADADNVISELRDKGILVRDCSNFKGLGAGYIRIAVKSHKDNEMLIKELVELCRV